MTWFSFARAKDAAVEEAIRAFLGPKLSRYGQLQQLRVDTSARILSAEIQLHGDPVPLVISEAHYDLVSENGETYLTFHNAKVSREWVLNLLEDYLGRVRLKIPEIVGRVLG